MDSRSNEPVVGRPKHSLFNRPQILQDKSSHVRSARPNSPPSDRDSSADHVADTRGKYVVLGALLLIHALLLARISWNNAPASNEPAHLAAGLSVWEYARFDLYCVNPPLVRTVAAIPLIPSRPKTDWRAWQRRRNSRRLLESRPEWRTGEQFVAQNLEEVQLYFALARWACIPFALFGAYFTWRWARELYGDWAGVAALGMWCLSPNITAWSATIYPDAPTAALGIAAGYCFWRWLREPDWVNASLAGVMLGLGQLTKMTCVLLLILWPVIWLVWRLTSPRDSRSSCVKASALQMATVLAAALLVLNMGYGFEGSLTKLGEYSFATRALAGPDSTLDGGYGGNRFADTWLAGVPMPVPYNYLRGIDLQRCDFEYGMRSYLCGRWQNRGWWYYYFVCAALKVPLGIWGLGFLALALSVRESLSRSPGASGADTAPGMSRAARYSWRDELVLVLPTIVLFAFVSSQTGFSRHFRYVLPSLPFLFIWISKVVPAAIQRPRPLGWQVTALFLWSATSSVWIYPHSMSYFNELTGGPKHGDRYLLGSNLDCGQDFFYLRQWQKRHPEAAHMNMLLASPFGAELTGARESDTWRQDKTESATPLFPTDEETWTRAPVPGWYATRISRLHDANGDYSYFLRFEPVATVGYSIHIYHITLDEANRVRRDLGAPELGRQTGGS